MTTGRGTIAFRRARLFKTLLLAVLIAGLCMTAVTIVRICKSSRDVGAIEHEITILSANVENMRNELDRRHNLPEIGARAKKLGMTEPEDGQVRTVTLSNG